MIGQAEHFKSGEIRHSSKVVVVDAGGSILTLLRTDQDRRPRSWDLPGGGALIGESDIDCAWRETGEETNLWLPKFMFQKLLENNAPIPSSCGPHNNLRTGYVLRLALYQPTILFDPNEAQAYEWRSPVQAERVISHPFQQELVVRFLESTSTVSFQPSVVYTNA